MKEVLGIRVDIAGKKTVDEVHKRVKKAKKNGELDKRRLEMEKELGLNKEIDPQKKALIDEWEGKDKKRRTELEKIRKKQEEPIISSIEKKELTNEEKRNRIEKLKEYLQDLKNGKAHYIVANIETEKESVNEVIEKLEKELEEEN